jgi:hypothetical protein
MRVLVLVGRDGVREVRRMSRTALILLMGCIVVLANAAGPSTTPKAQEPDEELDLVLVEGRRPVTETRKLTAWIDRLAGQFSYEGYVERYSPAGPVDRVAIHGESLCARFDKAVAVQCEVNVTWNAMPGAAGEKPAGDDSPLVPAVIVYGLNSAKKYFGHLQVDSNGVARGGRGWLVDDTLISRDPCADFPDCLRVVRLEAPADTKVVRMRVDLEQNGRLRQRHYIQWIRLPSSRVAEASTTSTAILAESLRSSPSAASLQVPADIDAWLRRLPGSYRIPGFEELCGKTPAKPAASSIDAPRDPCPRSAADKEALKNRPADVRCQGIGAGPGVRCAVYMDWPESGIPVSTKWYQTLNPHFLLYGYDPVQRGIALALVSPTSRGGSAGFTAGVLKDDKLLYTTDCPRPPCTAVEQVSIAPGSDWVMWQISQGSGTPAFLSWRMFRIQEQGVPGEAVTAPATRGSNRSPRGR